MSIFLALLVMPAAAWPPAVITPLGKLPRQATYHLSTMAEFTENRPARVSMAATLLMVAPVEKMAELLRAVLAMMEPLAALTDAAQPGGESMSPAKSSKKIMQ